jgi:hypothetical protein
LATPCAQSLDLPFCFLHTPACTPPPASRSQRRQQLESLSHGARQMARKLSGAAAPGPAWSWRRQPTRACTVSLPASACVHPLLTFQLGKRASSSTFDTCSDVPGPEHRPAWASTLLAAPMMLLSPVGTVVCVSCALQTCSRLILFLSRALLARSCRAEASEGGKRECNTFLEQYQMCRRSQEGLGG